MRIAFVRGARQAPVPLRTTTGTGCTCGVPSPPVQTT
jgi:hypothetical protein